MLTIGFANHYYTLWNVVNFEYYDASRGATYLRTNYRYIYNLSMDFESAKSKLEARGKKYAIDLDLRGENGRRYFTERMIKDFNVHLFTFGKFAGADMRQCVDVWQLERAMKEERGGRRRTIARRRLIDLGELVQCKWHEKFFDGYGKEGPEKLRNWMPRKMYERRQQEEFVKQLSGHYFNNGDRIKMMIKQISSFHFDTQYGTMFVVRYLTDDNKVVSYKGSNPELVPTDSFVEIIGTIEHTVYNGINETRIKRVKVKLPVS